MVFEKNILRPRCNSQIRFRDFGQQVASGEDLNLDVKAQLKRSRVIHRTIASPEVTTSKTWTGMRVFAQMIIQAPNPAAPDQAATSVASSFIEEAVMRPISQYLSELP